MEGESLALVRRLTVLPVLVALAGVLVLQHLLEDDYEALGVAKYAVNTSIFLVSVVLPKRAREQRVLGMAFKFVFVADFFLVLAGTLPGLSPEDIAVKIPGLAVFSLGYFCFSYLALQGAKWNARELAMAIPILAVALPVGAACHARMRPEQAAFFWAFLPFVSFVGWCGLSAYPRGAYRPEVRRLFALSGCLFFLSELGVAVGTFFPGLTRNTSWIGNEIWLTYIPAWTSMLVALTYQSWSPSPATSR